MSSAKELESLLVGSTEVLKNPTQRHLRQLAKEDPYASVRVLKDPEEGSVYAWHGSEATHDDIANELGVPYTENDLDNADLFQLRGNKLLSGNPYGENYDLDSDLFKNQLKKFAPHAIAATTGASLLSPDNANANEIPIEDYLDNLLKNADTVKSSAKSPNVNVANIAQEDAAPMRMRGHASELNSILRSAQEQSATNREHLGDAMDSSNSFWSRAGSGALGLLGTIGVPETALLEGTNNSYQDMINQIPTSGKNSDLHDALLHARTGNY